MLGSRSRAFATQRKAARHTFGLSPSIPYLARISIPYMEVRRKVEMVMSTIHFWSILGRRSVGSCHAVAIAAVSVLVLKENATSALDILRDT